MKKLFTLILSFTVLHLLVSAQGCSDAGFCTLDANSPLGTHTNSSLNTFSIGSSYGLADNDIVAINTFLKYKKELQDKVTIETRLTSISQQGNSISSTGLSDIFINSTFGLRTNTLISAGLKIPLSNANKSYYDVQDSVGIASAANYSLPLDYQSSLGTFDLLLGVNFKVKSLQINAALQQPLTQNKNEYIYGDGGNNFQTTNGFERQGDVLLRVTYPLKLSQKINLYASILNIYHLGKDNYIEGNSRKEIDGSEGLTINATAFLNYQLNTKSNLRLNTGIPLIVRKVRPDGLTRSFVVGLEYVMQF